MESQERAIVQMVPLKCVVAGCKNTSNNNTISFFSIPLPTSKNVQLQRTENERLRKWLKHIGLDLNLNTLNSLMHNQYRVCQVHFTPDCFVENMISNLKCTFLRETAIPTLFGNTSTASNLGLFLNKGDEFEVGVPALQISMNMDKGLMTSSGCQPVGLTKNPQLYTAQANSALHKDVDQTQLNVIAQSTNAVSATSSSSSSAVPCQAPRLFAIIKKITNNNSYDHVETLMGSNGRPIKIFKAHLPSTTNDSVVNTSRCLQDNLSTDRCQENVIKDEMNLIEKNDELNEEEMNSNKIELYEDFFTEHVDPDFGLLDVLLANKSLTMEEFHNVKLIPSTIESRNRKLLSYMTEKHKEKQFLTALKETGQSHLINYLNANGVYKSEFGDEWPIELEDIEKLIVNRKKLVDDLQPCVICISCVINKRQKDFILSKATNSDKTEALLEFLRRCNRDQYMKLINCKHGSEFSNIVEMFEESEGVKIKNEHENILLPEIRETEECCTLTRNSPNPPNNKATSRKNIKVMQRKRKKRVGFQYRKKVSKLKMSNNAATSSSDPIPFNRKRRNHINQLGPKGRYYCPLPNCSYTGRSSDCLRKHRDYYHETTDHRFKVDLDPDLTLKKMQCTSSSLNAQNSSSSDNHHELASCLKGLRKKRNHLVQLGPDGRYYCPFCPKSCPTADALRKHRDVHERKARSYFFNKYSCISGESSSSGTIHVVQSSSSGSRANDVVTETSLSEEKEKRSSFDERRHPRKRMNALCRPRSKKSRQDEKDLDRKLSSLCFRYHPMEELELKEEEKSTESESLRKESRLFRDPRVDLGIRVDRILSNVEFEAKLDLPPGDFERIRNAVEKKKKKKEKETEEKFKLEEKDDKAVIIIEESTSDEESTEVSSSNYVRSKKKAVKTNVEQVLRKVKGKKMKKEIIELKKDGASSIVREESKTGITGKSFSINRESEFVLDEDLQMIVRGLIPHIGMLILNGKVALDDADNLKSLRSRLPSKVTKETFEGIVSTLRTIGEHELSSSYFHHDQKTGNFSDYSSSGLIGFSVCCGQDLMDQAAFYVFDRFIHRSFSQTEESFVADAVKLFTFLRISKEFFQSIIFTLFCLEQFPWFWTHLIKKK